ncbi:MAG: zf-HC2 domain-containing protein [Actinomycetota bacterium]|nr:zf-HC2 domain-containing protein [Actinomycetota bacterium]
MSDTAEMACQEIVELVTDYLEGLLGRDEVAEFEEHLVACAGCAAFYRRTRRTIGLLAGLGERSSEPAAAPAGNGAAPAGGGERYYKFTLPGAVGPFSGVRWPRPDGGEPGGWVEATGELASCANGVHACRPEHLPFWIGPELWVVELDGEVTAEGHKVFAQRGRLLERVEAWDDEAARELGARWAWAARDLAVEVLRAEGRGDDAERLAACADFDAVMELEEGFGSKSESRCWKAYLYAQTAAALAADAAGSGATEAAAAGHATGSEAAVEEVFRRHAAEMCATLGLSTGG